MQNETKEVSSKFAFCGHDEESSINRWLFGEVELGSYRKDEKEFEAWYEKKRDKWLEANEVTFH